ncbi:MAG TPA: TlpA disulfide reductase family protein [Pyrinomonadaceae bacterium]|jgi:peroxiredoxin
MKTSPKISYLVLFVVAAGLTFLAIRVLKPKPAASDSPQTITESLPGVSEGERVNLPELPGLTGESISLKGLRERYLLLAVFSTSCPKCAEDAGLWKDMLNEAQRKKVAFFAVSIDTDKERVKRFAQAHEFDTLPLLYDPQNQAKKALKSEFVPQYLLLTSDGLVIGRWDGVSFADTQEKRAARIAQFFQRLES